VRDVTSSATNCLRELLYRVRHKNDAKTLCSFSYANDCIQMKDGHETNR
jgi:hypothetical protein